MATSQPTPQQGGTQSPAAQQGQSNPQAGSGVKSPSQQQGGQTVIRDWASI